MEKQRSNGNNRKKTAAVIRPLKGFMPAAVAFASALVLVGLSAQTAPAASARNPYPPVKDNGTVGDAAGTDTAAYLNDKPSDRTGRQSPASGTVTPIPPPDVPGTPTGRNGNNPNGSDGTGNANGMGNTNGTGNSNGTGSGSGNSPGAGGSGSGSGSSSGGSSGGSGSGGG